MQSKLGDTLDISINKSKIDIINYKNEIYSSSSWRRVDGTLIIKTAERPPFPSPVSSSLPSFQLYSEILAISVSPSSSAQKWSQKVEIIKKCEGYEESKEEVHFYDCKSTLSSTRTKNGFIHSIRTTRNTPSLISNKKG